MITFFARISLSQLFAEEKERLQGLRRDRGRAARIDWKKDALCGTIKIRAGEVPEKDRIEREVL